jgi:hypothetical protein
MDMKDKEMHMKALAAMISSIDKASVEPFKEVKKVIAVKPMLNGTHDAHMETDTELEAPDDESPMEQAGDSMHHSPLESELGPGPSEEDETGPEDKMFKPSWMRNKK